VGIGIGIALKLCIHVVNGMPLRSLLKPYLDVMEEGEDTYRINASHSAVFSNWILFRRQIVQAGLVHRKNVIVDLSETRLVDHTVMEKLHEMKRDFEREGLRLDVTGLDDHKPLSRHPRSARRRTESDDFAAI
jgi:MFS superfamily sulfate permease-like transporter